MKRGGEDGLGQSLVLDGTWREVPSGLNLQAIVVCLSHVAIPVKNSKIELLNHTCIAAIFGFKHMQLEVGSGEAVVGKKFMLCAQCHTLLVDGGGCSFFLCGANWETACRLVSYLKF